MVSVESRMKGIEPDQVLALCKKYLSPSWDIATKETFQLKVLTQGFGNRLFVCSINDENVQPRQVLVRYLGGNFLPKDMPNRTLNETSETLLFYCLGQLGLAPKLYGVFDGGRLEEFIQSRNLSVEEFTSNPRISKAIARKVARYHAVDAPIRKRPFDSVATTEQLFEKFLENMTANPRPPPVPKSEREAEGFKIVMQFNIPSEIEWCQKMVKALPSRSVLRHGDLNRSNMLVKELDRNEDTENSWLERIMLIDYEFSGYGARGEDLGNHMAMRVFDFGSEKFLTEKPYPSEETRREFLATYADECQRIHDETGAFPNWDPNGADSVEHLLMETEFYGFLTRLVGHVWFMKDQDMFAKMLEERKKIDPTLDEAGPAIFVTFMNQRKEQFLKRFPQFANI